MAPVFLGAEDHPPRDRRPKCLTGSAITLVRLARPNPRGRHARVADPSGVECQRDGSDQGQRMEAGDGALTQDRCPAPSQDAHRSPAVPLCGSPAICVIQTEKREGQIAIDEYERADRHLGNPMASISSKRRTLRHRLPSGRTGHRARDRCPNGERLPGRLPSTRPKPGPGSAGKSHDLLTLLPCHRIDPMLNVTTLDCQKNIAYFLTHDDLIRLCSRSGHEACPRKRTRQRVHAARLP